MSEPKKPIESKPLKFCRDCKHYRFDGTYAYWNPNWAHRCWAPSLMLSGEFDLVTGIQDHPQGRVCEDVRKNGYACGPKGKLWELKDGSES